MSGVSPTCYGEPRGLATRKLATSPTSPRGRYEEVNDVTRKLRGTGPSGIWPYIALQKFQINALDAAQSATAELLAHDTD